ncbi:MAG: hypothetical protein A2Z88_04225 [Omnitrophica WOR_2 bacterium GWA2_47_8]|nr:MAG: hypothetical protein A2Z88_04225 [Omnitrophica WOR_2 bacterium GWA2_47_8]
MLFILLVFAPLAQAKERGAAASINCRQELSDQDIERVKASRDLLQGTDPRSLPKTLRELNRTNCPQIHAIIMEAIARTYVDIVREQKVVEQKKKDWLYSMVKLNMAYLQLTGGTYKGDNNSLNRSIRFRLKEYLPAGILTHPGFFQKVDELLE